MSWSEPLPNNQLLYDQLKKQASTNELLFLTGYQDDLVKILSFYALCERQLLSALEVAESSLRSHTITEYSKGCYQDYKYIADIFVSIAWKYTDTSADSIVLAKQNALNDMLLDIALAEDRHLNAASSLLFNAGPNPAYYNRIRNLAVLQHTPEAFIALAKYKKQQDTGLFISLLSKGRPDRLTALDAISNFADSIFFPYLVNAYYLIKDEQYNNERLQILRTIALYSNGASINFFAQIFESNNVRKSKKKKRYFMTCIAF